MKNKSSFFPVLLAALLLPILSNCKKEAIKTAPTATISLVTNITATSASSGGDITSDGGTMITARGVCWSTNQSPTTSDGKTSNGSGTGSFTSSITGLIPGATYNIKAYATNSVGTGYSSQSTFTTLALAPILSTTDLSAVTSTSANSGGNITNDGGSAVAARGVCWSTSQNPTIADSKISSGTGSGSFMSSITGLTPGTVYYVRAYATNNIGTGYGSQQTFTTTSDGLSGTVTDIDGNVYNTVTIGTQVWMAANLKTTKYRNGDQIPNVSNDVTWAALITGAYCYYNNDAPTYKATYGALYNWYSVADSRNIAPTGWHVPTGAELLILETFLGGEGVAGGKLKETGTTHWQSPNTGATNSSGFTAFPGGSRFGSGTFESIGSNGSWWSSSESDASYAHFRGLGYNYAYFSYRYANKMDGISVRCVRD